VAQVGGVLVFRRLEFSSMVKGVPVFLEEITLVPMGAVPQILTVQLVVLSLFNFDRIFT
jgi:hypothetical protein